MQEIIFQIRYFERGLSKSLKKKLTLFFLSNPVPFNGQDYKKAKRDLEQKNSFISDV